MADYKENKGLRLVALYDRLNRGETLYKADCAEEYSVTEKTFQRDMDDLRTYLSEQRDQSGEADICYVREKGGYQLVRSSTKWLEKRDVLVILKVLLESRGLCKAEMDGLIDKLLHLTAPVDADYVKSIIRNEQFHYTPPRHGKELISIIWNLSEYIYHHEAISIRYRKQDGARVRHVVKPVAILFSEYYFYLIAYLADGSRDFPTTFRIDRIEKLEETGETFSIPYKDRFKDGEFRKRVQFMYAGPLRRVTFLYKGPSLEAVLDRLPTAEVLEKQKGAYKIRVEVYGKGIDMWLGSQGDAIEILKE